MTHHLLVEELWELTLPFELTLKLYLLASISSLSLAQGEGSR